MKTIAIHPFRALTHAVLLVSSVGQSVLAQVNDDFADRIVLCSILPISATGSNVGASAEIDEPDYAGASIGNSVWWEWTAPFSGTVQIDTFGSDFDTELAVYTGETLATLIKIASNNDAGWRGTSRFEHLEDECQSLVRFSAEMGTTYQIAVDGYSSSNNYALNFRMAPPGPPNDHFEDRVRLPSGLPISTDGHNVGASSELNEPAHDRYSPINSVWWEWTAPSSGTVQIDTLGDLVETVLAVYTGMDLATLSEMVSNDNDYGQGDATQPSLVRFAAVEGTTYQIAVDGGEGFYTLEGNFTLNVSMTPPGPPNDNFADRIMLPSVLPTSTSGNIVDASIELNEPDHAGGSTGSSVWWEWTAPSSGTVEIDVFGSSFDPELAVYTGIALDTLSKIANASGSINGHEDQSSVRFLAVEGTVYQIAVAGYNWNTELTITMAPPGPLNDNFADRTILPSVLPTSTTGSTENASVEQDEPAHVGNSPGSSVWWQWTAPSSGLIRIDALDSDFDTELAVYTGMALGTLTEIASNNDNGWYDLQSSVRFFAVAGTTYQIALDGFEEAEGKLSLNIGMGSSPSVIQ